MRMAVLKSVMGGTLAMARQRRVKVIATQPLTYDARWKSRCDTPSGVRFRRLRSLQSLPTNSWPGVS